MRVIKLDKRYTGYKIFDYMIEPYGRGDERFAEFQAWREWCWSTFGPSTERGYVSVEPGSAGIRSKTCWCWYTEYNQMRLYFQDNKTLSTFLLKWS